MKIFKIIKEAALKFWKNPLLILPVVFQTSANFLLFSLLVIILSAIFGVSLFTSISAASSPSSIAEIILQIVNQNLALFIVLGVIFGVASIAVISLFEGSLLLMINSKNARFKDVLAGKRVFSKIFSFNIIFSAIILVMAAIIAALVFSVTKWAWLIAVAFLISLIFLFSLLFLILTPFYIVIDNANMRNSMKKSIKIVRKNYFSFLALWILTILIMVILGLVPAVGNLLATLIGSAYQKICVNAFAVDKGK